MHPKGKVVVVTGAGSGVGRALVQGFAREGARVAGISRTEADLEKTRELVGGAFRYVAGDVSRGADIEALFEMVEKELGPVDILVNNAAVYPKELFLDQSPDDFERALLINVMGVARCCHRALPSMLERGSGRIVNVGSYAYVAPIPRAAVYSASKGAVTALTRAIAAEVDRHRYPDVLVNEQMPGVFRTRMTPDQGEDPANAYGYLRPVATLPAGGPHGRTFLKGELQSEGGGGIKQRLKNKILELLGM